MVGRVNAQGGVGGVDVQRLWVRNREWIYDDP